MYDQKKAPDICTAEWIIYCMATKYSISITLIEQSDSASSYRGELMGMLIIYLFLYAIIEFYGVTCTSYILCNNKGVLYTFEQKSKRIPAGAKKQ